MEQKNMATDYELAMEDFETTQIKILNAQKEGVVLLTEDGLVEGWFVGVVEFVVGGYEDNLETDCILAFRKKNGRVVGAERNLAGWNLHSIKELGGVIRWGVYPEDLPKEKRSGEFFAPKSVARPVLSRFFDSPFRTDTGMSLFVVKVWKDRYGTEIYAGHDRKVAAAKMKEMRQLGYRCTALVFPVHRQNEYNELPF